jgi:hypothetical protein
MTTKHKKPGDLAGSIRDAVTQGTRKWTSLRKSEQRNPAARRWRGERMRREASVKLKQAAWEIMEAAYTKASGNSAYPANARQIMYAARGHIQARTGRTLNDNYFTQTLLPDYVQEHRVDWDVVYDARGHFQEPHGGMMIGVGTIEVRNYLAGLLDSPEMIDAFVDQATVRLQGPAGNFGAILFVEKEGFWPLFKAAQIAERFDIAPMSTKGMSVTAARELLDKMCSRFDVPALLLHDFDKAGFSIAGTLQHDTRRFEFQNAIETIDLGLSLDDVEAMGLESEYQHHPKGRKEVLMANLRANGATEDEIAFMFRDFDQWRSTRRVELNAMTSPQFVAFLERKLREHHVAKIVPDVATLNEAYVAFERGRRLEEAVEEVLEDIEDEDITPPKNLEKRVRSLLKRKPAIRWDAAVAAIVDPNRSGDAA